MFGKPPAGTWGEMTTAMCQVLKKKRQPSLSDLGPVRVSVLMASSERPTDDADHQWFIHHVHHSLDIKNTELINYQQWPQQANESKIKSLKTFLLYKNKANCVCDVQWICWWISLNKQKCHVFPQKRFTVTLQLVQQVQRAAVTQMGKQQLLNILYGKCSQQMQCIQHTLQQVFWISFDQELCSTNSC